ncbi:hypothetical protein HPB52_018247 [Rhipicephalus sanguineus]|uniref:Uncharacterized protein n=2 Tax=Rhipicephalus sanguineus TaxID=34632 RepID=A0A9D4PX76_RHISA|nr:hypothetical protein HPB52_018247 [Rhipicephalus sanguineus]
MATSRPRSSLPQRKVNEKTEAIVNDFATFLYKEGRDVFQNIERIKRFLRLADRRFQGDKVTPESFFNFCTHEVDHICWALFCHARLNAVIAPHGFQLLRARENSFALQTLENSEDTLSGPDNIFATCVCIWLLRTHSCISKVVLNVATVARFHAPLFWKLLFINTRHLDKVELIGLPTDQNHFRVACLFEKARELSEIVLVHIPLTDEQAELLCSVIAENEGLERLVLKYVNMTTTALEVLRRAITKYSRPMSFELREKTGACEGYEDAVTAILDTPVSELCLETPCNWAELFKRLRRNTCLCDLEIIDRDSLLYSSLTNLAEAVLENTTLRCLKLTIRPSLTNAFPADHWCKLTDAIGRNRALTALSFASSSFCEEESSAIASLAEGIARNKTLVEVSVEDCDLSLTSLLLLLDGLARNERVEILRIGALSEDEEVNRSVFKRVAELGLGERVDCEYVLKSEWLLDWTKQDYERTQCRRMKGVFASVLSNGDRISNMLDRAKDTLTCLHLEGKDDVPMSAAGASSLHDLFANSNVLEHVKLLCNAVAVFVVRILSGLASSRTIYSVLFGRKWQLSREVAIAFAETLQENSSIAELTIWQDTRMGFEELKEHLRFGVSNNYAIHKIRLLYGPERKESHDLVLPQILLYNRTIARRAAEAIIECHWTVRGLHAFTRMNSCVNCRAVLRRATGFDDVELDSQIMKASKWAGRQLPRIPLIVTEDGERARTDARNKITLRDVIEDFIKQAKIFLEGHKR